MPKALRGCVVMMRRSGALLEEVVGHLLRVGRALFSLLLLVAQLV